MTNSTAISDISAELIHRDNVPLIWLLVRDRLQKTIDDFGFGELELEDLFTNLVVGRAQLWIVNDREMNIRLIAVTRIVKYPKLNRLLLDIVVGEGVVEALALLGKVETWASAFGARQTETHARPALARILQRHGAFKQSRMVLIRECNVNLSEAQRQVEQRKA